MVNNSEKAEDNSEKARVNVHMPGKRLVEIKILAKKMGLSVNGQICALLYEALKKKKEDGEL